MAPHSSTLAWKIPWTEEPGGPQSMGSLRVGQDSATSLSVFTFMHWRRKWQPTPVFLSGESQGWRSLVGCHLWVAQSRTQLKWLSSSSSSSFVPWITDLVGSKEHQFSLSISNSLWPHGLQHTRFHCPSQTPRACSNHVHRVGDAIQPSHPVFSPAPPALSLSEHQGLFQRVSSSHQVAKSSASVLPMNIQDWFLLGLTGLISLQTKGLSRVFSNTTVQKRQFFGAQLSLWFNFHIHIWLLEKPQLWL